MNIFSLFTCLLTELTENLQVCRFRFKVMTSLVDGIVPIGNIK